MRKQHLVAWLCLAPFLTVIAIIYNIAFSKLGYNATHEHDLWIGMRMFVEHVDGEIYGLLVDINWISAVMMTLVNSVGAAVIGYFFACVFTMVIVAHPHMRSVTLIICLAVVVMPQGMVALWWWQLVANGTFVVMLMQVWWFSAIFTMVLTIEQQQRAGSLYQRGNLERISTWLMFFSYSHSHMRRRIPLLFAAALLVAVNQFDAWYVISTVDTTTPTNMAQYVYQQLRTNEIAFAATMVVAHVLITVIGLLLAWCSTAIRLFDS